MALSRKCTHAAGAGAYHTLLDKVVENVDAIAGVVGRAGGPVRGRAAVKLVEATAATAVMAAVAVVVVTVVAALWAASALSRAAAVARAVVGQRQRWQRQWQ